jgi:dihydrofolate synthase/folylpolyglutamate synthase
VEWILDVAHNPAGAWALRAGLKDAWPKEGTPRILIFSCLRDKPIAEMAQILFPALRQVILAPIHALAPQALDLLDGGRKPQPPQPRSPPNR